MQRHIFLYGKSHAPNKHYMYQSCLIYQHRWSKPACLYLRLSAKSNMATIIPENVHGTDELELVDEKKDFSIQSDWTPEEKKAKLK